MGWNLGHRVIVWINDFKNYNMPYKIYSMIQISVIYIYIHTHIVVCQKNHFVEG